MPLVRYRGRHLADPHWALAQAVCELDRRHGIAILDSALQLGLVETLHQVRRIVAGRRDAARTRTWWGLVDGRAESPLETEARLQCHDAGMGPDDLQVLVHDDSGRVLARGDLGWRLPNGRWLLVEIDGARPHTQPAALYTDRRRQNAIISTGRFDVLRFTARDLVNHQVVPTIQSFLSRPLGPPPGRTGG
ncbi:MAG: endonuclease domain-containing protein [Actinobacteria bacterium]|nr:endonuclease domain-containing protein [Actinomycetota bacterium]